MIGNFVFDIDGTLADCGDAASVEKVKQDLGEAFHQEHCMLIGKRFYHIYPGFYALFRWLHSQKGKIAFFSAGFSERNIELAEKMMKKAFATHKVIPKYKVFSVEDCYDVSASRNWDKEIQFKAVFTGRRKKIMKNVVVPTRQMDKTLLIDDDTSFMPKGEEYNFVKVVDSLGYWEVRREWEFGDRFFAFHKTYYLAGLLTKIFAEVQNQKISLVQAAQYVQFELEGQVLTQQFRYPSSRRVEYVMAGLAILQQFDPTLKLYLELPTIQNRK